MSRPAAISVVHTAPVKLVGGTRQNQMSSPRVAVIISVHDDEPEEVFLSFDGNGALTSLTGMPLYPGQSLPIMADSALGKSVLDKEIWAISATQAVNVRIQEVF